MAAETKERNSNLEAVNTQLVNNGLNRHTFLKAKNKAKTTAETSISSPSLGEMVIGNKTMNKYVGKI